MPGGNRMGPMGQGPMTGRALGRCTGGDVPGPFGGPFGRGGAGGGFMGGRGFAAGGWRHRNWFYATGLPGWLRGWRGWPGAARSYLSGLPREAELASLKQQATGFEQALDEVKARIQELEQPADTSSARR
jgi:hypothetical protein